MLLSLLPIIRKLYLTIYLITITRKLFVSNRKEISKHSYIRMLFNIYIRAIYDLSRYLKLD